MEPPWECLQDQFKTAISLKCGLPETFFFILSRTVILYKVLSTPQMQAKTYLSADISQPVTDKTVIIMELKYQHQSSSFSYYVMFIQEDLFQFSGSMAAITIKIIARVSH
jgi:hypothetical protein